MQRFSPERPKSDRAECLHQVHTWSSAWQKRFTYLFFSSLFFFGVSFFFQHQLPDNLLLKEEIANEPVQTKTDREEFTFEYRNAEYDVEPVAEYEMWGLVVSHNNINSIADIYHDEDSVDLKDLCIIWGKNTESDYKKVKFWSNAWTCWWQYGNGVTFSGRELSNNHLLSDKKKVQDIIKNVRIGDQIRVKGMLVNYNSKENPDWKRESSTTREDTGNGACEVVFVEEAEVLARGEVFWQSVHHWAFQGIWFFLLCKFFLILIRVQREKACFR